MTKADANITTADQVVEGLFEWMKKNPWFIAERIEASDVTLESAAQDAVLGLARGEVDAYRAMPERVRQLVVTLTLDFMAKVMGPWSTRHWPVSASTHGGDLQRAAWLVIEHEVLRSHRPAQSRH